MMQGVTKDEIMMKGAIRNEKGMIKHKRGMKETIKDERENERNDKG
jgi:hypothetical protein